MAGLGSRHPPAEFLTYTVFSGPGQEAAISERAKKHEGEIFYGSSEVDDTVKKPVEESRCLR
jgi:hypothetical protein